MSVSSRTTLPDRLERSMLSTPAASYAMIEKAAASAADAVCIDLEDSVAPGQKAASRANVARAFRELDFGHRTRIFRINALDTPFAYRDLIEVVEAAGDSIDLVIVPKVDRPADVQFVDTLLTQIEAHRGFGNRIGIEAQIETALGCLNADAIAAASPRLEALVYGPGDFAASVRMPAAAIGTLDEWDAVYGGHRFHYVMQRLLVAGRAAGLRVIDGPFADYRDLDGFRRACLVARALGFDGKWCIHPSQIPIANEVFAPTEQEIAWAERVVASLAAANREGRGAVAVDGTMIDAASIRMAEATLDRARAAGIEG